MGSLGKGRLFCAVFDLYSTYGTTSSEFRRDGTVMEEKAKTKPGNKRKPTPNSQGSDVGNLKADGPRQILAECFSFPKLLKSPRYLAASVWDINFHKRMVKWQGEA